MKHVFTVEGARAEAWLAQLPGGFALQDAAGQIGVALSTDPGGRQTLQVGSSCHEVVIAAAGDTIFLHMDGRTLEIAYHDPVTLHAGDGGGAASDSARAPMPGSVLHIPVQEGSEVKRGDTLVVIESMKIEVAIKAERDGVVEAIHTAPGRSFDRDAVLVTLAPLAKPQEG